MSMLSPLCAAEIVEDCRVSCWGLVLLGVYHQTEDVLTWVLPRCYYSRVTR